MQAIFDRYGITESEYSALEEKYEDLCRYQSWQLIKKNSRNNHTNEWQDVAQDMRIGLLTAGAYYKRQVYIEKCLRLCDEHCKDKFIKEVVKELKHLWENKTRHGASRQKYGPWQERILEKLVRQYVPKEKRPSRKAPLKIDSKFNTYCKAITWNAQKSTGKKITREKTIRSGMVSLSEHDHLT